MGCNLLINYMIKTLLKSADFMSLPVGLAAVLGGAASAALMGNFEIVQFSVFLMLMVFLQIGANLFHKYCDADKNNGEGVERYIKYFRQKEEYPTRTVLREGVNAMALLALMTGMQLVSYSHGWALIPGALVIALIYFNSAGPHPISSTPFNYLVTFIGFGPLAVISVCCLMARHDAVDPLAWHDVAPAIVMSFIIGLLAGNTQLMYNYKSYDVDLHHGKQTLVTFLGKRASKAYFIFAGVMVFVAGVVGTCMFDVGIVWVPIAVCAVPMIINTIIGLNLDKAESEDISIIWKIQLNYNWMIFGVALALFILFLIFGESDMRDNQFF